MDTQHAGSLSFISLTFLHDLHHVVTLNRLQVRFHHLQGKWIVKK